MKMALCLVGLLFPLGSGVSAIGEGKTDPLANSETVATAADTVLVLRSWNYLEQYRDTFYFARPSSWLRLDSVCRDSVAGAGVFFSQIYKGVKVYGGGIAFHFMNMKDDMVDSMTDDLAWGNYDAAVYGQEIDVTPKITLSEAMDTIGIGPWTSELILVPENERYRLCWCFYFQQKDLERLSHGWGSFEGYVDSVTGEYIYRQAGNRLKDLDMLSYGQGSYEGYVDAVTGEYLCRQAVRNQSDDYVVSLLVRKSCSLESSVMMVQAGRSVNCFGQGGCFRKEFHDYSIAYKRIVDCALAYLGTLKTNVVTDNLANRLQLRTIYRGPGQTQYLRFVQRYDGIEVFGGGITVLAESDGTILEVKNELIADSCLTMTPRLGIDEATETAMRRYGTENELRPTGDAELVFLPPEFQLPISLCWRIRFSRRGTSPAPIDILVDSNNGKIMAILPSWTE
jgi:hypothetical protein